MKTAKIVIIFETVMYVVKKTWVFLISTDVCFFHIDGCKTQTFRFPRNRQMCVPLSRNTFHTFFVFGYPA